MSDTPLLSVITPSYNEEKYIQKTIESIFEQPYSNIEQIIVDGGSTDGTIDIIKKYEKKYNIKYKSESDGGISAALNKGIRMSNGSWLGWQNANDYYLPNSFKTFANEIQKHPDADLIYGDTKIVNAEGKEINRLYAYPPSKFIQRHWSNWASNQSSFFNKQMITELGGFDTDLTYTMDSGLLWDILHSDNKYKIIQVQKLIGAFRRHEEAMSDEGSTESVYQYTTMEDFLPDRILTTIAQVGKGIFLIKQGRTDAIKYRINNG